MKKMNVPRLHILASTGQIFSGILMLLSSYLIVSNQFPLLNGAPKFYSIAFYCLTILTLASGLGLRWKPRLFIPASLLSAIVTAVSIYMVAGKVSPIVFLQLVVIALLIYSIAKKDFLVDSDY